MKEVAIPVRQNPLTSAATAPPTAADGQLSIVERIGERLNPLLVKECRQSMKSRQFSATFTLIVVLSWLWSIYGIARLGGDVAYGATGPEMFYGYFLILAFALLLVVPYSAYRSLIAEREDNTYELVAITTLRSRQIVAGKLGSALAQMLVYLSAIAPCLAFTYVLRGIDVLTICWILFYLVLGSLGFSLCALLLASVAKERHWQVTLSVFVVVGLFMSFVGATEWCHWLLRMSRLPFQSPVFWGINLAVITAYASTFALFYLAAGAQISFTAENRSTPLRAAMLVQQACLAAWAGLAYVLMKQGSSLQIPELIQAYVAISMLYWFLMGGFMLGELTEISRRVKRTLPKSFLGRIFFTWFNPGPGTGLIFAIANAVAAAALAAIAIAIESRSPQQFNRLWVEPTAMFVGLSVGYVAILLALGNVIMRLARRATTITLAAGVSIELLLVCAGVGFPPWSVICSTIAATNSRSWILPIRFERALRFSNRVPTCTWGNCAG